MSFHCETRADSSDDEDGVDLAAWQSNTQPKVASSTQNAPVAIMEAREDDADEDEIAGFMEQANDLTTEAQDLENGVDESEEDDVDAIEIIGSAPVRSKRKAAQNAIFSSGFTSINVPIPRRQTPSSDEDEVAQDLAGELGKMVPMIPRSELDADARAEFEDFTTGGDVVKRVMKELKDGRANLRYKVEFEDWSVAEVSLWFSSCPLAVVRDCVGYRHVRCFDLSYLGSITFT